ncbi:O-antigen polymerase [Natronolimnohabitans innermongolicus]|uniref:O-antigen polymerase n=1 Tax=Natronolimnohabitans innermongolicus TaxID=253107 RepID=UPI000A00EEEE|nr:O-antigen polymerase [Natronolimnohabitans innermongolicus]
MIEFKSPKYIDHLFIGVLISIAVLVGFLSVEQQSLLPLLLGSLFVVICLPWYLSIRSGRFDIFEPIIFHSIFTAMLAVALFDRVYLQEWEWRYEIISYGYTEGFLLYGGALLLVFSSTIVGYYGTLKWGKPYLQNVSFQMLNRTPNNFKTPRSGIYRILNLVDGGTGSTAIITQRFAFLFIGVGLLAFAYLFIRGPLAQDPFILYTETTPRSQLFSGYYIFTMIARLIYVGYFLWLASSVISGKFPSLFQIGALPLVMSFFLILGQRGVSLSIAIVVFVFCYYCWSFNKTQGSALMPRMLNKIPTKAYPIFVGLGLLFSGLILPVLAALRQNQPPSSAFNDIDVVSILTAGIHNSEIDNFLALTEVVPSELNYYYGSYYLRVLTNYIPRSLWEDKPVLTVGGLLRRLVNPERSGGSPPGAVGNYYINGGYLGIILMGVLLGVIFALMYYSIRRENSSGFALVIYSMLLVSIGRRGLENNLLAPLLIELLPILIVISSILVLATNKRVNSVP